MHTYNLTSVMTDPQCMDHAATLFCATLILTKATADAHSNKISLRRDYRISGKLNFCIFLNTLNVDFLFYILIFKRYSAPSFYSLFLAVSKIFGTE